MSIGKVIKWMVVIVLLLAVAAAGALFWFYQKSDELIREQILTQFARSAPDWDIGLQRARFDGERSIHLYNLTLASSSDGHASAEPLLRIRQAIVNVDAETFVREQRVSIDRIRIVKPVIQLIRAVDGTWNWQQLKPLPERDSALPDWDIENATIEITLQHGDGLPDARMAIEAASVRLISAAKRVYTIEGNTSVPGAGVVAVSGMVDLNTKTWELQGRMTNVAANHDLLDMAVATSPDMRLKLAEWNQKLQQFSHGTRTMSPQVRTASVGSDRPHGNRPSDAAIHPGVSAVMDVEFRIASHGPGMRPDFRMVVGVRNGEIDNPALPFPLRQVRGTLMWDNDRLIVDNLKAMNGDAEITIRRAVHCQQSDSPDREPSRIELAVDRLPLDDRLRRVLPPTWLRPYDQLHASGTMDIDAVLTLDANGKWIPEKLNATANQCTMRHEKFPYPVTGLVGTCRQLAGARTLVFDMTGEAGRRPVKIDGQVKNPGPEAESVFVVTVEDLPIDDTLAGACDEKMQRVFRSLQPTGLLSARVRLHRPAGFGKKFQPQIAARVSRGTIEFDKFRYRLTDLGGTFSYSPESRTWTFPDLIARHGDTDLKGDGDYVRSVESGRLKLNVSAVNARFDDSLHAALGPDLQRLWEQLGPDGHFDTRIAIDWIPGKPADIRLPQLTIRDGKAHMAAFPYAMDRISSQVTYERGQIEIKSFTGYHGPGIVRTKGMLRTAQDGAWRLHLDELTAGGIMPDQEFLQALPGAMHTAMVQANPTGTLELSRGEVEIAGNTRHGTPVTAGWDIETRWEGNQVEMGLQLTELFGVITSRGTWDGLHLNSNGELNVQSVKLLGYQLSQLQGPYTLTNDRLVIGSSDVFASDGRTIDQTQRVNGKVFNGDITIDAETLLDGSETWKLMTTLSGASLDAYARQYVRRQTSLRGVMRGWTQLSGNGGNTNSIVGRGQLQISPAALYELPVMFQMFNLLSSFSPTPPSSTAFDYAMANFNVGNGAFNFNSIDLVGSSMNLRGRGRAGFNGSLNLNFFFKPLNRPQNLIKVLVNETYRGWMGIDVSGSVSQPHVQLRPRMDANDALGNFLNTFNPVGNGGLPQLSIPNLLPRTGRLAPANSGRRSSFRLNPFRRMADFRETTNSAVLAPQPDGETAR